LCGGGAGPLSSVWSPLAPFPLACGKAPGACCGAGVDSCIGSLISSLGLAIFAVLRALNRRNSSGGKLSGCESEDLLRKANEELARGLLGFFSFSRWSRSLTTDVRVFFSGDDCADLVLCASAESVDGRGRGDGGNSLGGGVEGFLRVKMDGSGSKKTN